VAPKAAAAIREPMRRLLRFMANLPFVFPTFGDSYTLATEGWSSTRGG
jgi:hypothetical protein